MPHPRAGGERPGGASASPPVGGGGGGGDTRGGPRRLSPVASLDAEERVQADACSSHRYHQVGKDRPPSQSNPLVRVSRSALRA
jgi:hypothetical protein